MARLHIELEPEEVEAVMVALRSYREECNKTDAPLSMHENDVIVNLLDYLEAEAAHGHR